jgi:acyl-CoA thioesterase YciA
MVQNVGLYKTLFGGNMMAWIDEAAAIFAKEYTREKFMVTLRFGEFLFLHPVREGDVVHFWVSNPKIGKTSLSFEIEALRTDGVKVVQTSCVFVSVDDSGRPKRIENPNYDLGTLSSPSRD